MAATLLLPSGKFDLHTATHPAPKIRSVRKGQYKNLKVAGKRGEAVLEGPFFEAPVLGVAFCWGEGG